jgi:hypothetical protein
MNDYERKWIIAIHSELKSIKSAVVFLAWLFGTMTALGLAAIVFMIVTFVKAANAVNLYP